MESFDKALPARPEFIRGLPFSVLIADDKAEVRSALRLLLDQEDDMEVVGEARDGSELRAQTERLGPALLLLDWELDRGLSQEVARLRGARGKPTIIALSGRPESRKDALLAGVDAFVSKAEPPERLLAAIRAAYIARMDGSDRQPAGN